MPLPTFCLLSISTTSKFFLFGRVAHGARLTEPIIQLPMAGPLLLGARKAKIIHFVVITAKISESPQLGDDRVNGRVPVNKFKQVAAL